jgi:nitrite reductase/ring-hydroxylating ferredoxin subunit
MKLRLGSAETLARTAVGRFEVTGHEPIALYHTAAGFFASADNCRHKGASLAAGELVQDTIIVCPWHGGGYDIRTGAAAAPPCRGALPVYRVVIEDGWVFVELPDDRGTDHGLASPDATA